MNDHAKPQRPMFGLTMMLFSVMVFTVMDALVKWLSSDYPTWQIMFFRSAVALVPVMFFVINAGGIKILKTTKPHLHLLRASIGACAMYSAFTGIGLMPLADAMAIFHSAPILMTAISVPLLGEIVGIRRWSAVCIGFVGVLLVVKPGMGVFASGAIYMIAAAFFVALTSNLIRILARTEEAACITFYFTVFVTLVAAVLSMMWGWEPMDTRDTLLLMCIGVLGGCGQFLMTVSFKHAEVGLVSPLKYLMIVFGGILGFLVWNEVPDRLSLIGIAIIIASGVYTMHREAQLKAAA